MSASDYETWLSLKNRFIDNRLMMPAAFEEAEKRSQATRVRHLFLDEAIAQAKSKDVDPSSSSALKQMEIADEVADRIVWGFTSLRATSLRHNAATEQDVLDRLTLTPKGEVSFPNEYQRLHFDHIDPIDAEHGVSVYLESNFRIPEVDRILLIALTDMEIAGYLRQVFQRRLFGEENIFRGYANVGWWIGLGQTAIGVTIGLGLIFAIHTFVADMSETVRIILFAGVAFLAATKIGIHTWALLFYGAGLRSEDSKIVQQMTNFQFEVHGPGSLSVPHFRKLLEECRQSGIVWPKSIWAILDDLDFRGVTRL